jgi:hypothetical protein
LFSFDAIRLLVVTFGLHAVFALDHILISSAARSIVKIMQLYDGMLTELATWFVGFPGDSADLTAAFNRPDIATGGREMIRLGVALTIRGLVREAASVVLGRSFPGFGNLLNAAAGRADKTDDKEELILELCTTRQGYYYLERAMEKSIASLRVSDIPRFFFFLGLFLGSPALSSGEYERSFGSIQGNLHLFAPALGAFVGMIKVVSISGDPDSARIGMETFYAIAQQIYGKRVGKTPGPANALLVLIDLIAREVTGIEYGRISAVFPRNLINDAYDAVNKKEVIMLEKGGSRIRKPSRVRSKTLKL